MKKTILTILLVLVAGVLSAATTLTVTWSAPVAHNEDPNSGAVASYDLRYSADPITEDNFAAATSLATTVPKTPGELESYVYTLPDLDKYFLAVKSANSDGGVSPLSNVVVKDFFLPDQVQDLSVVGIR